MKLEVLQENLVKGLSLVARSLANKPQLPILANILLSTDGGRLKLSSTNLETGINTWVGAKVLSEGSFTVPGRTFVELINALPPGKIILELAEGQLLISSEVSKTKINGIPAAEWPAITSRENDPGKSYAQVEIPAKKFNLASTQTCFAAAIDESRPVLTGALLKIGKDSLDMAATDGFRLSLTSISPVTVKKGSEELESRQIIIPVKALSEAAKVVLESKGSENISVYFYPGLVWFIFEDLEIFAKLIEGSFPSYQKIIPVSSNIQALVDKEDLIRGIKTASIFARDSANIIKFKIGESGLKISANAAEIGENEAEVPVDLVKKGESDLSIAFNFHYLLDFLGCLGSEERISMEFSGSITPGLFKAEGFPGFVHVVMPVRVQS